MRFALLLIAISLRGQTTFPVRSLADAGDVASRREERPDVVRLEGRDRAGQPWRVWLKEPGAVFQASYSVGDLDRDGQPDLLVERPLPGLGRCVGRAEVLVLRMDARGRPVPLVFESAAKPVAIRRGRDGTAEFFASNGCSDAGHWIGLKALVRVASVRGRLEELRSAEFGGSRAGESLLISGRWVRRWPSRVVLDDAAGRDVYLHDEWLGLRRAFAYGCHVRFDGYELWAEGCGERRVVDVELQVTQMRGAAEISNRLGESTLDGERNAIHTAHTSMGVTHRHTTEYEAPEPGARLISLELFEGLTQWQSASGVFLALHDDGRLREPRITVTVPDLTFAARGYLRWRVAR